MTHQRAHRPLGLRDQQAGAVLPDIPACTPIHRLPVNGDKRHGAFHVNSIVVSEKTGRLNPSAARRHAARRVMV